MTELDAHVGAVLAGRAKAVSLVGRVDDLTAAYAVQDRLAGAVGPTCGWKIAANTPELMQAFGIPEPIVGRITGAAPLPSGAEIYLSDHDTLALEPEIVAVLAHDVTAPLTDGDVADAVASFHAGFEILDLRGYADPPHGPSFVAYNVFNAGVAMAPDPLAAGARAGAATRFELGGEILLDGGNTAPQPPAQVVRFVVNKALSRGQLVTAGQVILCGTHHPPVRVSDPGLARFTVDGSPVNLSISG